MYIRLKDFRQTQRLYQSDLAEIMGTTQSVISRMEFKEVTRLKAPHYKILCERFGKEVVDEFCTETLPKVVVSGNNNNGVPQNNIGISTDNSAYVEIIKRQAEAMAKAMEKQTETNDRLLALLEKMADR